MKCITAYSSFFFLVLLFSCGQKKQLTIKDLQIPDPEKEAIIKNHISVISGFDTVKCKIGAQSVHWTDVIASDTMLFGLDVSRFDKYGNRIYYKRKSCDWLCGSYSENTDFVFDSLGFEIYAYGHTNDSFFYVFSPRERVLLKISHRWLWTHDEPYLDTTKLFFNDSGRLEYELHPKGEHNVKYDTVFYKYIGKKLIEKRQKISQSSKPRDEDITEVSTSYYYNVKDLDSVIIHYQCQMDRYNMKHKYYYDNNGLPYKSILWNHYNDKEFLDKAFRRDLFYTYRYL